MAGLKNFSLIIVAAVLASISPLVAAKTCDVAIEGNDQMQFNKTEIAVAADCTEVNLTLKHTGKLPAAAMGHNWVLTETAAYMAVANAGAPAGAANSFVPQGDARVLAHSKLIGGGESTTFKFATAKLKKAGDYTFFCSFPGHWTLMKGKFKFG